MQEVNYLVHDIPYSREFSHGAKFRTFRGWVSYHESLNVRTIFGLNTEKARKLKPGKISSGGDTGVKRESLH